MDPLHHIDFFVKQPITLNPWECKALYDWIARITTELGGDPSDVFNWDETDDSTDPLVSALYKVYEGGGGKVPHLRTKQEWIEELKREQEVIARGVQSNS